MFQLLLRRGLRLPEGSVPERKDAVGILSKSELKLRGICQFNIDTSVS